MTADKDDPRFDEFYRHGSEARAFLAIFLVDLPSYTGLGFELRDIHVSPAANECYTKLYVFQESEGPNAIRGPYRFGRNGRLYGALTHLQRFAEPLLPRLARGSVRWLLPPDATGEDPILAWTVENVPEEFLFIANVGTNPISSIHVPHDGASATLLYSTLLTSDPTHAAAFPGSVGLYIPRLNGGECRVYRLSA
jgi:hypothetical protein